ncbi:MAG: trypsin-like peptidase domain-containing protein [Ramlibacter sp.]|nr:trypsin-like peptidase domain-containing protein [Ramlibacter sp.]
MNEPLLFTTARIATFVGQQALTAATGFFFARDERLFFVTSRHVLIDKPSAHLPDRVEITLHTNETDLTQVAVQSILLYDNGRSIWRQGRDSGGEIDVAVIEFDLSALPAGAVLYPFTQAHLVPEAYTVNVGTALLMPGFPLGFYDTVHHLPVVRQAIIASAFGVRFQGQGFFLTDARAHRGSSGAPVVMRDATAIGALKYRLVGIHSSRMDMGTRDRVEDESLGLNIAWYADIMMTLTDRREVTPAPTTTPAPTLAPLKTQGIGGW